MKTRTKMITLVSALIAAMSLSALGQEGVKHHKHSGKNSMNHSFDDRMKPILTEYLKLHKSLMAGKIENLSTMAKNIEMLSNKLDPSSVHGEHAGHYKHIPMNLGKYSKLLNKSKTLSEAREVFKKLSQPMAMWVGMAKPKGYQVMFCPMVKASWVQKEGTTQNPYDDKMPSCGSKV